MPARPSWPPPSGCWPAPHERARADRHDAGRGPGVPRGGADADLRHHRPRRLAAPDAAVVRGARRRVLGLDVREVPEGAQPRARVALHDPDRDRAPVPRAARRDDEVRGGHPPRPRHGGGRRLRLGRALRRQRGGHATAGAQARGAAVHLQHDRLLGPPQALASGSMERLERPRVGRNTALLSASLAANSATLQLSAAVASLTLVRVIHVQGLLGLGPAIVLASGALVALPAGRAMDRVGRVPVLAAGFAAGALGSALAAAGSAARLAPLVLLGLLGVGAASGTALLARTAARDMYPPERRARGIALVLFGAV